MALATTTVLDTLESVGWKSIVLDPIMKYEYMCTLQLELEVLKRAMP